MTPPYSPDPSDMLRSQSQSCPQALRPPPTPLIHHHRRKRSRSVRPSLLGAIEFADVVHSLSSDQSNAANVLAVFGGGHQHHAHSHDVLEDLTEHPNSPASPATTGRRRAHSHTGTLQLHGGEDTLANGVLRDAQHRADAARRAPLGPRRTTWTGPGDSTDDEAEAGRSGVIDLSKGVEDPWKDARSPLPQTGHARSRSASTVPPIYLTTANGSATALSATRSSSEATITPLATKADLRPHPSRRQLLSAALGALFPSLQSFRSKSLIGKVTALLCVPALLALNLTLPVAEEPPCDDDCSWTEEKPSTATGEERDGRQEHADEEGTIERIGRTLHSPATLQPHEHDASPTHRLQHLRAEATEADAPSPSLAWGEVTRDPLEPLNLGSPAVALQQNPLEEFGVVQSSEAAEETSRREMHPEAMIEQEAMAREHVTRALTAMQCALGPVFVVTALFGAALLPFHVISI